MVAYSGPLGRGDAVQAKMKALLTGLRIVHSKELMDKTITIEGDSANVIGWMKNGKPGPWRISHLIKEAVFLASSINILFAWIPREANSVANGLAKKGVNKEVLFMGLIMEEPHA